ncbi:MAG TPA: hypothetical protein VFN67_20370 [Polyangiales bacterium]|nr:hypothetical protein [Polyangiales bacterium]
MELVKLDLRIIVCAIAGWFSACGGENASISSSAASVYPGNALPQAGSFAPAAGNGGQAAAPPTLPSTMLVTPPTAAAGGGAMPPVTTGTLAPNEADALWCGVKRTVDSRCIACHNEMKTAGAPMSLKTYTDMIAPAVSDPTKKVFQVVGVRVHDKVRPMPPQDALTADQLSGIDKWVAAGAPSAADPTCAALNPVETGSATAERVWPTTCDETVTIKVSNGGAPQQVAAGQEAHPQEQIAPPWGNEDVQAIAWHAKTDNAKIMHHWILYGQSGAFLFGWAPGKDWNEPIPDDVGVFLPGQTMRLDMHYNNVQGTTTEKDDTSVDICILKKAHFRPKTAGTTNRLTQPLLNIPARATGVKMTGTCAHTGSPVNLLSVSPHAHRTAKHMTFTVEKANGMKIVMHDMDFNFMEQTTYPLRPAVVVESGDRVITTCIYDNDTDRAISFGENTGNEMCYNFAIIEPLNGLNCGGGGRPF